MSVRIAVLGTGGTIAGVAARADDHVGYSAGALSVGELLGRFSVPDGVVLLGRSVAQIDSKDMSFAVWRALVAQVLLELTNTEVDALIITHGTDTIEETAWFLQQVLRSASAPVKPVVLTCAMRPASALVPDGPQNLQDAISTARALAQRQRDAGNGASGSSGNPAGAGGAGPAVPATATVAPAVCAATFEVYVVCAGVVHAAQHIHKRHPYRLNPFSSGDAGPSGYVEEGAVRWLQTPGQRQSAACRSQGGAAPQEAGAERLIRMLAAPIWPRVELVHSHAGSDAYLVDLLCAARRTATDADAVQGLVVVTTGNGTVHEALEAALVRAQGEGILVLRASRCTEGPMVAASAQPLPAAANLTPEKARISLVLELLARAVAAND